MTELISLAKCLFCMAVRMSN